jgi:hypothetical protein
MIAEVLPFCALFLSSNFLSQFYGRQIWLGCVGDEAFRIAQSIKMRSLLAENKTSRPLFWARWGVMKRRCWSR